MRIGDHDVLGEIGRGGMGTVYRVRTPDGREAALKLFARATPATLARFEREARLLASLGEEHGFVSFLGSGTAREGPWLLMPLVPGGTLRQKLLRGPLGVEETIALGARLARALGEAHTRGIVHRDVKPENVLFDASGRPLLADLGLAKHFDSAMRGSLSLSVTQAGTFNGTAGYVAPEQIEDASRVGPSADVFALGAVLYECLSGRPAFRGESVLDVLAKLSEGTVEPIGRPDVPAWLDETVRKALALDRHVRFADGASLARALAARGSSSPPRGRWAVALGALLVLAFAGVAAALVAARPAPVPQPVIPQPAQHAVVDRLDDEAAREERLGDELRAAADCEGSLEHYARARDLAPRVARLHRKIAEVLSALSRFPEAIAAADSSIAMDPRDGLAFSIRGWARGATGDPRALGDAEHAVALDPKSANVWFVYGNSLRGHGRTDEALDAFDRSIELDPKIDFAYFERAQVYLARGDRERARADLDKSVECGGAFFAWRTRALLRAESGDREGAIADAEEAVRRAPRDPGSRDLLARLRASR